MSNDSSGVVIFLEQFFLRVRVWREVVHLHLLALKFLYNDKQREVHERSETSPSRANQEANYDKPAKSNDLFVADGVLRLCDEQLQPPVSVSQLEAAKVYVKYFRQLIVRELCCGHEHSKVRKADELTGQRFGGHFLQSDRVVVVD